MKSPRRTRSDVKSQPSTVNGPRLLAPKSNDAPLPAQPVSKVKSSAGEFAKLRNRDMRRDLDRIGVEFLMVEAELGNTFADRALVPTDAGMMERNREQAQRAYDEVRRYRTRVEFAAAELLILKARMKDLKAKLDKLQALHHS